MVAALIGIRMGLAGWFAGRRGGAIDLRTKTVC
jgi:hypothetical protein